MRGGMEENQNMGENQNFDLFRLLNAVLPKYQEQHTYPS